MVTYRIVPSKCPWALTAKRQNLRVDGYTENVLKLFNYPHARAHPGVIGNLASPVYGTPAQNTLAILDLPSKIR